jgi:hypothetical protein
VRIACGQADRRGGRGNDGGTLALDDLGLRGNSARGGGLVNNGRATLADVIGGGKQARSGGLADFGTLSLTCAAEDRRGRPDGLV